MTVDPVTLAVIKGRLEQIADEMDVTLFRAAFSPVIAEARDASHGIYEAGTGDTLIQGKQGLPIFVGVMSFAVKTGIAKAEADGGASLGRWCVGVECQPEPRVHDNDPPPDCAMRPPEIPAGCISSHADMLGGMWNVRRQRWARETPGRRLAQRCEYG